MADPFPPDPLPDLLGKLCYGQPYETNYEILLRKMQGEDADDDVTVEFNYWVGIASGLVFGGRGSRPGLTELSEALLDHLVILAQREDFAQIGNWWYRLWHLREHFLRLGVPALRPLECLLPELRGALSLSRNPKAAMEALKASASRLKSMWSMGSARMCQKLIENLVEGDVLLIIGHSRVIERAVMSDAVKRLRLSTYLYCPGPEFPHGRVPANCEATCPFVPPHRPVYRPEAISRIRRKEITKVLCATCAYSWDAGAIWITRGGEEIALEATRASISFLPIGGDYKLLRQVPEDFLYDGPSSLADLVFASAVSFDSRFLG